MGKEITVRQNRCDREMNFLLFCGFFFFLVTAVGTGHAGFAGRINRGFYLMLVPGFFFAQGYRFHRTAHQENTDASRRQAYRDAARFYAYFFLLAFGQELLESGFSVGSGFRTVLVLIRIPSVSAVFFALAVTLVFAGTFSERLCHAIEHRKARSLAVGIICLCCSLLCVRQETYPLFATLFGAAGQAVVPVVPYFAYFLLGMWFEDHLPGFRWSYLGIAAAVSGVSVFLYFSPARYFGMVTLAFLPVYLLYLVSEGLTELTLRFRTPGFLWSSVEPVIFVSALIVFGIISLEQMGYLNISALEGRLAGWMIPAVCAAVPFLIYLAVWFTVIFGKVYGKGLAWFETKAKHRTLVYFLLYTLAFPFMMALVFFAFLFLRRSFVWVGDGLTQYYPRAVYFSRYIRELLSNLFQGRISLPMYDFRNGMGSEIIYSFEPLYFLYVLFDENHMEFAYNLIMILRFYLTGITSSVLFLYFKKEYFPTFLGSVVYMFCGFALYGGAKHPMFMIPMIMLPLLIIAVEEILRGRRWYLCTIFVAVSLFSNYYYLYMSTIAMGIYFLVRFFCQRQKERRTFRNFMIKGLTISGSYLLGVAMSCIVLVTTFGSYLGSARGGKAAISTPSLFFYSADWLVRCFEFFITASSPGNWLKLGYLPVALLAVVFMYTQKGKKEQKILFAIATVFMMLPVAAFVFSGFNSVINRWCYIISLLAGFIVADCLPEMSRMKRRSLWILTGMVLLYGFLAFSADAETMSYAMPGRLGFVELAVTLVVLLACHENVKKPDAGTKKAVMLVLTFGLLFGCGFAEFILGHGIDKYMKWDETEDEITETPLAAVSELDDDSFYRVTSPKVDYLTSSASLLLDYYPVTTVSSVLNGNIQEYLEKMGATSFSVIQLRGLGNRAMLHSLAAVKYYAEYADEIRPFPAGSEELLRTQEDGREVVVVENQYALPLGYTYRETISEEELEQYTAEERQEVLMQKVVLGSAEDSRKNEAIITGKRLELRAAKENGLSLEEHALVPDTGKKKHRLKLTFEGMPDSETYLVLRNVTLESEDTEATASLVVKAEGDQVSYTFSAEGGRYRTGQEDYVINLGYHEEAINSCTVQLNSPEKLSFEDFYIYCQPMDHLEQYTQALTEDVLEHVELGTNRVSGDIDLSEDKILVLSIPYQNGWTALVDGEPAKLERANYMYMALPLEAGKHTIELNFEIPGMKYALVIMPCAAGLFLILCLATWIVGRRRKRRS